MDNTIYTKFVAENCNSIILLLLVFGASKNAIFPLSGWLNAAMVAPIPVSSLLHAVAVVNTGIIVILKFGSHV
jgi:NADH:ubiquinone oxidoreductase subunit 5 (subunit L)/multisubunit Na+/H+ antiporter MnhA subunit